MMTQNTQDTIIRLYEHFEALGYFVEIEPIPGEECDFIAHLQGGLSKAQEVLDFNAKHFRFRGRSKRAIASLHRALPTPVWGVEVSSH